ncbi:MAG: universal stress protein [Sporomusaceae bacterium]|nr:universal stress protein [Sporomusaceae bacterium]
MIELKKIVVAYDGSEHSKRALDWAVKFAGASKAVIDVVMVLVPSSLLVGVDYAGVCFSEELKEMAEKEIEEQLEAAKSFCEAQNVVVHTATLFGNVVDEIQHYVTDVKADMVICGTRGLGGFEGLLVGSVAHKLVTYLPVPVLAVK